jgi:photosystem II stability/assembly factor-like uncharacterized protein
MRPAHRVTTMGIVAATVCLLWAACFAGAARASIDYLSASFVDTKTGWVAGIDNATARTKVWRTSNGGVTWKQVASSVAAGGGVGWVAFVSKTTGIWGNGSLLRTTNGGRTWTNASTGELGILNEACFATADVGWAGCSYGSSESGGAIAATSDGGVTWKIQKDLPGPDGSGGVSDVSSPSVKCCYALKWGVGEGVWATEGGGAEWTLRPLPHISGGAYTSYRDIDFPGEETGWVVGDAGTILKTDDGGVTWEKQESGVSSALLAVDFVDTSIGFAVGKSGRILRTLDGGSKWATLDSGTQKRLSAACFVSASRGWVVGKSGVRLRTADGGRTWRGQW